ncbi:MAG: hypothetical protein ABFS41_05230 [Myxococcota bacterium]
MRRGLTILLVLALVFAGAALAGFWLAARMAPERLRVESERQLARVLKGDVQLASLELARSSQLPWIWLEARGARAILKNDVTLLAGRVRARLDPLSLLLGRLGIADLRLEDVVVLFPPRPDEHPERTRLAKIMRPIEVAGEFLRKHPCGIPDLEVTGLTALVPRDGMLDVLLEAGDGSLRCAGLRRDRSNASLTARVRRGDETFSARFGLRTGRDEASLAMAFDAAPLRGLLGTVGIDVPLSGEVRGNAKLVAPAEGTYALDLTVTGRGVRGGLPESDAAWFDLELPAPRLSGKVTVDDDELRVHTLELTDGGIQLSANGTLARPTRDEARARAQVKLAGMALRDASRLLDQLPEATRIEVTPVFERVEQGRFTRLRADATGSLEAVRGIFQRSPLDRAGVLRLRGGLTDATLRIGESDRLTDVDATLAFDGSHLELDVTESTLHGSPLPGLAMEVNGIENLRAFDELDCRTPADQPPLPGIRKLQAWLNESRDDPETEATLEWQRLALELDWVSHPALGCSLEQVLATLEPTDVGFDFGVSRGVWAGLPVQATGHTRRGPDPETKPGEWAVTVQLGPPFEAMSLDPPSSPWLSGRFELEASRMGRWRVEGATGRVEADGSRLELPRTVLRMAGADLEGLLRLELGEDALPFEAQAQFAGLDLLSLWEAADLERGTLVGTLHGAGAISGHLQPGLNPLADARGLIAMHARDGTINEKIPVMLAIAIASDQFNPFGDRDELPYDAIDSLARVEGGKIVFDMLQLHAPTLRMGASATGDVVDPYTIEGVIGLFFFPGLDSMIDRVPILNRVILGRNNNLVGAYFSITGGWGQPQARLIPIQTLATGPTGFLTEGLPSFVMGGIRRIQSALQPSDDAPLPPEAPRADS